MENSVVQLADSPKAPESIILTELGSKIDDLVVEYNKKGIDAHSICVILSNRLGALIRASTLEEGKEPLISFCAEVITRQSKMEAK